MNYSIIFMRNRAATRDLPSEISRAVLQDPNSRSQGPGSNVNSRDEIQAVEGHMRTLTTCLIMIMADQRTAASHQNPRFSPAEERHLERMASSLRGALQALLEKRDRLVQERANGKSLWN